MYHFVRDLVHSRYPGIKGLDVLLFKEQIKYLEKHYTFITMESLIEALETDRLLPSNSVLLSFDDGYIDHFNCVFPILAEKGIQGSFYPPAKAITENKVLDVNKIHFILASEINKSKIVSKLFSEMENYRKEFNLEDNNYYVTKLAKPNRFDTGEVILIKRLLQVELPEPLRNNITNTLFKELVGVEEAAFSRELYMNHDQLKCMRKNGMHIGSHGYDHYWLGRLSKQEQEREIDLSMFFLNSIGVDMSNWTMCYPYGNYNQDTLQILSDKNCKVALTTEVQIASLSNNHRLSLPRLDTNDLPKDGNAKVNEWHAEVAKME